MSTDARRGRPRNESCTVHILEATLAIVSESGISGLTMDAVASRAGVGKATIYRRWPSKEALLLDAWTSTAEMPEAPDTGSLRDDLSRYMLGVDTLFHDRDRQRVFPQMIAAAKVDPEAGEAYRAFVSSRRAPMQALLQRAVDRGEIPADVDIDVIHDLLVAPMMYRWLITDAPIDQRTIGTIIDVVVAGVTAAGVTVAGAALAGGAVRA